MLRLADQQISPSYNGHRVTIKVNRSNEAIANNHSSKVKPKLDLQSIATSS